MIFTKPFKVLIFISVSIVFCHVVSAIRKHIGTVQELNLFLLFGHVLQSIFHNSANIL